MTKKVFTLEPSKSLNDLSDVELIELMAKATFSDARMNTIKAILDYRLKIVLNDLKEATKVSIKSTDRQNKYLLALTLIIAVATLLLLLKE